MKNKDMALVLNTLAARHLSQLLKTLAFVAHSGLVCEGIQMPSCHRLLSALVPAVAGIHTVSDLLLRLAHAEVSLASRRQRQRRSILPVGLQELDEQLQAGRAGVADLPSPKRIDPAKAIQVVTDAFTDGLILLFVDERRCMRLDEPVEISPETRVLILRLTMLTG